MKWAKDLGYPFIVGGDKMKQFEKDKILMFFKTLKDWNVLFISRVGDTALDIPDANVGITLMSQGGSRRQEAQRVGRLLRPKKDEKGKPCESVYWAIISKGTGDGDYSQKRQKF